MTSAARALLVLAALLAWTPAARASGWERLAGGEDPVVLVSLSAPDAAHLFAAGLLMDGSAFPPQVSPRVYASADGGKTWRDASGNLAAQPFTTLNAVSFVDASRGWVAGGKKVWSTLDAGAAWTVASADAGLEIEALHFFDVRRGVAVGGDAGGGAVRIRRTADGGRTWTAASVPAVEGAARSTFWLSDQVGWAAGSSRRTVDPGGGGETYDVPKEGFTLATTDGGATWTVSDTRIADYGLGPVFFLRDGRTGWAAGYKMTDPVRAEAALYKSTDGGKTWTDAQVPLEVGKFSMMGTFPINTSYFLTMFWASETSGHLGGTVYLSDSSDGQGPAVHVYKVVDYRTEDGTTWQRTDLGTLSLTTPVTNDGTLVAGQMIGLNQGWMVGDKATVWGYAADPPAPCDAESDCAPGFGCSVFGKCQPVTCPDGCPEGQVCSWQACRTPPDAGAAAGADGSAPAQYDDAGRPVVAEGDGGTAPGSDGDGGGGAGSSVDAGTSPPGGQGGCGCSAGAGPGAALAGLLALLGTLGATRRSRIR